MPSLYQRCREGGREGGEGRGGEGRGGEEGEREREREGGRGEEVREGKDNTRSYLSAKPLQHGF